LTPHGGVDVYCLCAAWCRLCEAYAAVFARVGAELAAAHPGLRFASAPVGTRTKPGALPDPVAYFDV
jgi:hypothetical protein